MAIFKKKGSPYYYTRFTLAGIRVYQSTKCDTKKDAQEYEDRKRQQIKEQILLGRKPSVTWQQAALRWLDEMTHKRSLGEDISILKWLQPYLNHLNLSDIDKVVLENIAREKEKEGASGARVNRIFDMIKALLNRAKDHWDWLSIVPPFTRRTVDTKRIRWITHDEADALLAELPSHLKAMAAFTLATGLRSSNVTHLKWEDVDIVKRRLVIHPDKHKNKKALGIYINQDGIDILRDQLGKHPIYVFTYLGNPVTQTNTKAWRKALIRANIKNFRWHDLRHTWASWHVQNGTSLQELAQLGGWSSFEMVLRYAHLGANHLANASENSCRRAKSVATKLKRVK